MGIGVRVTGRIVGQWLDAPGQAGASAPQTDAAHLRPGSTAQSRAAGQAAGEFATQTGRGVSRGIGGFLRPFRRVGGIVWLEVTGAFFLLFAVAFALRLWQSWSGFSKMSRDFAIGAAVVFVYLGVTAFWRARRR
jgi:hypothetical protein